MNIKLHKQATTTPRTRAEIQAAPPCITDSELARQFSVSPSTIRRWPVVVKKSVASEVF